MAKRRVVVTGMGMVTPLGLDAATTWSGLLDGRSGAAPITHFDTSAYNTQFAAMLPDFDVTAYMPVKETKKMDVFIQYGFAAGQQAMQDSGLEITDQNRHRFGVMVSSGIGGIQGIEESHAKLLSSGPRRISPFFIPASITNMLSGQLSMHFGLTGPSLAIVTACTTGVHNIGQAARMIAYGDADAMLAGGAEKASTPLGMAGFNAARALSTRNDDPQAASRPWDKDRDGFVLGDGAGVMVLEEYEHAKQRGATIYAELAGFGMSSDAYHMTLPPADGRGAAASMQNALDDAGLNPEQVGYINAHGTSTGAGDLAETAAIKSVFADYAYQIPVSSTKSMTGHLLGAAGAVEAIISVQSLLYQKVPPTINLDNPDVDCDLDYVPHTARDLAFDVSLCNSFGFGGTNGSLLFTRA
ncbi:beta-ketoacyl-[acyl-carrier-protein] synthase II [Aliidiomarina minuta]|uniref:3-oxoacyl-[acyl-carrier-protein] synthase 2 n=1 Tax=Aliidiomarina minuta TaxID=880057 RepID=A0A432W6H9_9GAMM|nr:beta-ketoacyl-ACP synthase II [Aliidiomarina minuta]RUO25642.1 beta-ketoacyl-[acyl-carrier-protein] synthase II [Aliidiomarina minuta]